MPGGWKMRNINKELEPFIPPWVKQRNQAWLNNMHKKKIKYMRCMDCLKVIPNDNNLISKHFREEHIKDSNRFNETGFRIRPA